MHSHPHKGHPKADKHNKIDDLDLIKALSSCRKLSKEAHEMVIVNVIWCWLTLGANLLNSLTQFGRVESGTTIRKGPRMFIVMRCDIAAIHCIVFPNPISSASIPFTPFSNIVCKNNNRILVTENKSYACILCFQDWLNYTHGKKLHWKRT